MFGAIAPRYDFLNHLLSFQQDRIWRKRVIRLAMKTAKRPFRILDLCCGTGDLALGFSRHANPDDRIIGADFTESMLQIARTKDKLKSNSTVVHWVCADGLRLPFADSTFDLITVAFGIRNFENLQTGLSEISRAIKPGGQAILLEFSRPSNRIFRAIYGFYFRHILPKIGRLFTKTESYYYLHDSVMEFPKPEDMKIALNSLGFSQIAIFPQSFGIATIYQAKKKESGY